jgi:hypothetical protein
MHTSAMVILTMEEANINWAKWPTQDHEMKTVNLLLPTGFKITEQLRIHTRDLKKEEVEDIFILIKYTVAPRLALPLLPGLS